ARRAGGPARDRATPTGPVRMKRHYRARAARMAMLIAGLASLATSQASPGLDATPAQGTLQFDGQHTVETRMFTVHVNPGNVPAGASADVEIQGAVAAEQPLLKVSVTDPRTGTTDAWTPDAIAESSLGGFIDICDQCSQPTDVTYTITVERLANVPAQRFAFAWTVNAHLAFQWDGRGSFTIPPDASISTTIDP
ncbi:MAG TPA: hypothetical protein VF484_00015, partial [Candidatus Limnocylindrales bacterium]